MKKINHIENKDKPWIIAHRGYRGCFPENTLSAFEAAIKVKSDMIELDVAFTSDRIPVVIHDSTLDRTTDGKGLVSDFCLNELKELDAGSWFKKEFKGEKIPTLEETLDQIRGRISANIEIKPESFETSNPSDSIEIQICNLLERYEMEDSVVISSFEYSFFFRINSFLKKRKKTNHIRIAPLQEVFQNKETIINLCRQEKAYSYHPNERFVTEDLINFIKYSGYRIFPYTINKNNRMEELIKFGVDGIITDEPEILYELIENI